MKIEIAKARKAAPAHHPTVSAVKPKIFPRSSRTEALMLKISEVVTRAVQLSRKRRLRWAALKSAWCPVSCPKFVSSSLGMEGFVGDPGLEVDDFVGALPRRWPEDPGCLLSFCREIRADNAKIGDWLQIA
jgi:hypothetical protein